jgi:TatD DNase family protein
MVDAHCHLDLYPNPLTIAEECESLGIYTLSMTNLPSHFKLGFPHLKQFKKVRMALGMHPLYADKHAKEMKLFAECVSQTSYIGEIGLDFSKEGIASKDQQISTFKFVLNEISGKNKIVSLHSRGAEEAVFNYLIEYNIKNAIFHWYSGSVNLINAIVKAGFLFSINPAMVKSKIGQEVIKNVPLTHILTESDGPFIQYQNRSIKPSDLAHVEDFIAKLHGITNAEMSAIIRDNFRKLISLLQP